MHAKSGLRVLLKWKVFRPDSVIAAVIPIEMNVSQIVINGKQYPLDLDCSGVSATIDKGCDDIAVSVVAEAKPSDDDDYSAVILRFAFVPTKLSSGWNSLANLEIDVANKTDQNFILPDNPATIYLGWHLVAINNQLSFSDLKDGGFHVKWNFTAVDFLDDDDGIPVKLDAWLPITCVNVHFPDLFKQAAASVTEDTVEAVDLAFKNLKVDAQEALQILSQRFERTEYTDPSRLRAGLSFPYSVRGITKC